ncbi:MAG: methylmalonyl Co-A mutase-associated GTPase MeaB [Thermodesulfobacteriota bacterium]
MTLSDYESGLIDKMLSGDRASLARLISIAESRHKSLPEILMRLAPAMREPYIIGITGPPGAGKSTITNRLIRSYRDMDKKVGVLAVDPSSPFTGGAILGDRIRMHDHAMDDGVFIRSISTRGTHGGLSRATVEITKLYGAYGMDYVIIETVGVGQTELDIVGVADTVLVVLVPEAGDSVQTMKAGLMEIADVFIVNKADREGAALIAAEIKQVVSLRRAGGWTPSVLLTSALSGEGIEGIIEAVEKHRDYLSGSGKLITKKEKRIEEEFSEIVRGLVDEEIARKLGDPEIKKIYDRVKSGEIDPYEGAVLVVSKIICSATL